MHRQLGRVDIDDAERFVPAPRDEELHDTLERFNRSQDYELIHDALSSHGPHNTAWETVGPILPRLHPATPAVA